MSIQFAQLNFIWLLFLIPLLVIFFLIRQRRRHQIAKQLFHGKVLQRRHFIQFGFWIFAYLFLVFSFLRPQMGFVEEEMPQSGRDIMILLDVSDSMRAQDVAPNRMERARREIYDLLDLAQGDRVGVIAFSGIAFVACPLTSDLETVKNFVSSLDTETIPAKGSDLSKAFSLALQNLKADAAKSQALILLTDGENTQGDLEKGLDALKERGIGLYILGLGTPEGAPIPSLDGSGFKQDAQGQMVISKLDEAGMEKLAEAGEGDYSRAKNGDSDWTKLYVRGIQKKLEIRDLDGGKKKVPLERFQWPLALGLLLLTLEMMIRPNVKMLLVVFLLVSGNAQAGINSLFEFQKANEAHEAQKWEEAQGSYERVLKEEPHDLKAQYNLGNTFYREGKFDQALESYQKAAEAKDETLRQAAKYNTGNANYRLGKLQEAVDAYNAVLEENPEHENAKKNRDFVLEQMKKKQENPEQSDKPDSSKPEKSDKSDSSDRSDKSDQAHSPNDSSKPKESDNPSEPEQKPGAAEPKSQKRQNYERLLQSLEDDPGSAMKDVLNREVPRQKTPEKDW